MSFQIKTEDMMRLGATNPSSSMMHMLSQPQSNINGYFMQQYPSSQNQINVMGQDLSSLVQGASMMNVPLNQGSNIFNQQFPSNGQMVTNSNIDANNQLSQQFLLSQNKQQPQQNYDMNLLLLLLQQHQQQQQQQQSQQQQLQQQQQQLQQQISLSQKGGQQQNQPQQSQQNISFSQQQQQQHLSFAQQQQQQQLLSQHLHLLSQTQQIQNQKPISNGSNLLINFPLNNSTSSQINPLGLSSLLNAQQVYSSVKEEEQDIQQEDDDDEMEGEEDEEEEQVTAQQSPGKLMCKNQIIENQKFEFGLDAEARARAPTATYNPIGDYKMVMMQTPIQNTKRESNFFTPFNQQLPTQQLIQTNNNGTVQNLSGTKLPEFQLNQVQPQIQIQNFLQLMKMKSPNMQNTNNAHFSPFNINPNNLTKEQIIDLKRQMGVTVRDRETLAPFLEQWNSLQETEQIINGSYNILKQFSLEKSEAYENQFKVEYIEQSQKCNYVNKFINSKGLIVKDEKLGKIKIENKISRFHNLSRLLMYTILTAFNKNNLALMNLDQQKQQSIIQTIQRLKQSARKKTPKGLIKTDFFNHTHYNVLFLTINESNIDQVRKNSKDVGTHMKVFNVNLERPYHEIVEQLRYSNIIKKLAYHIMLASYKKSKDDKQECDSSNSSNSTFREQYIDRAMVGIGKLNQGALIQRF